MDNFRGRDGQGWRNQGGQELRNFSVGLLSVSGCNRSMVIQRGARVMSSSSMSSKLDARQGLFDGCTRRDGWIEREGEEEKRESMTDVDV
jgi:hypothetical protein